MKHIAIIVALFVAGFVFWGVGKYAEGAKVDRSVERTFPYQFEKSLRDEPRAYAVPVLFPLDLVVMLLLAGSLAWAAATWGPIGIGHDPALYLILPLAYLLFDFAEDSLLILLLTGAVDLTAGSKTLLTALTGGKLIFVIGATGQAVVTAVAAVIRGFAH